MPANGGMFTLASEYTQDFVLKPWSFMDFDAQGKGPSSPLTEAMHEVSINRDRVCALPSPPLLVPNARSVALQIVANGFPI